MADGAQYIRSSAKRYQPEIVTLFCKFHFWKAIRPKIYSKEFIPGLTGNLKIPSKFKDHFVIMQFQKNNITQSEIRSIIKSDIRILEVLPTKELYLTFLRIILPFWKFFAPKFYDYFWKNYLDQNNSCCLSGWQNFIKLTQPGTNNAVEGINGSLKQNLTKYEKIEFGKYLELISEELIERSEQSAKIASFTNSPFIPITISRFALKISEKFQDYFLLFNDKYYIKDKLLNYSLYNRKSGAIKKEINLIASKVNNNDEETINKFLHFYSKPSIEDVQKFVHSQEIKTKLQVIRILSIRQITIYESSKREECLSLSSCTCPDFFKTHICQHLLACLIQKKMYDPTIRFKKPKKKGRKAKVGPALERE